ALAQVITDTKRRGQDIGNPIALAEYQRWRRFDNTALGFATDGFNQLFSNDNPILRGLRDIGMGAINAMPGVRKSFMRQAAGLSGELPNLLKGQDL
ncbi:MAG: 2-octaprenyl-6-methoxyphenyl hydroxylase, partial [Planktomarina sp.]